MFERSVEIDECAKSGVKSVSKDSVKGFCSYGKGQIELKRLIHITEMMHWALEEGR